MQSQWFCTHLIYYYYIRPSCLNEMISLYCKIPYLPRIIFHYFLWLVFIPFLFTSKPVFLNTSQCIFLSTQPCLLLYSLCAKIGHSHTMCLTVSSTLPHNQHISSALVLSGFAFIAFVLMACFCAAIISDSVFLFILLSLSHSHFSSPGTSSIWLKNSPYFAQQLIYNNTLFCSILLISLNSFTLSHSRMLFIISIHSSSCYEQYFLTC